MAKSEEEKAKEVAVVQERAAKAEAKANAEEAVAKAEAKEKEEIKAKEAETRAVKAKEAKAAAEKAEAAMVKEAKTEAAKAVKNIVAYKMNVDKEKREFEVYKEEMLELFAKRDTALAEEEKRYQREREAFKKK